MGHLLEPAVSGRAKCRGCGDPIAKDELRFGERLPNPFSDGEMTLWFHPMCAAYKRPEPLLEAMDATGEGRADAATLPDAGALRRHAATSLQHRRLPRLDGAQRSPTGRARCRACRELIGKESWRLGLVYFEEGRFNPSGYIHAGCAVEYLGTGDIIERVRHFSPALTDDDLVELRAALAAPTA